jgi:hypothetical protein
MDKYFVLVAGAGTSSRANIEALLEDHYYKHGKDGTLVLAYKTNPSPGQMYAVQFSKDKDKDLMIFTTEGGKFDGATGASVDMSSDPLSSAVDFLKGQKSSVFILWSDEDSDCQHAMSLCKDADIPCFDLTEGLLPLTPPADIKPVVVPVIPEQETLEYTSKTEDEDEDEDEEEEDGEEVEDEEEYEEMDDVYFGLEALAKFLAKEVTKEVLKALEKPQEGDKA